MIKTSTMRQADRWLGVPVCLALTAVRRLLDFFGHAAGREPPQRILFVKLVEQGSSVLACSAIRRAIDLVGRENVYFLVFQENRFILDAMGLLPSENVIAIRTAGLISAAVDALQIIRRIRALEIDTAIDLEFFARSSAALSFLSGARYRVGFQAFGGEGPYRGDLLTHRLRFNPYLHTSQTFCMLVEALTIDGERLPTFDLEPVAAEDLPPPFCALPDEVDQARALLRKASPDGRFQPLILLNANCSDLLPLRRWPIERYRELARRLLHRFPEVRVAMTGGPEEGSAVAKLVEQVGSERCFNLAGRTTLRQLLVIYGLAEVLVTNDSGPAHFAALTPIDVVTLFGPENPRLFAARTARNHVFWAGIACSPCVSALNGRTSPCKDNICMQRIDVDRVFKEVCRIYETRTRGGELLQNSLAPDDQIATGPYR
jgi:ADP-heptose:LPS heptosyltransferase